MKKIKFGYGENGCIKFDEISNNLSAVLKAAVDEGHGFIVREEYGDNGSYRRVLVGWRIKVLSYNKACEEFKDDEVILQHLKVYYANGNPVFVVAPVAQEEKMTVFPAKEYDRIEILKPEKVMRLIKESSV